MPPLKLRRTNFFYFCTPQEIQHLVEKPVHLVGLRTNELTLMIFPPECEIDYLVADYLGMKGL